MIRLDGYEDNKGKKRRRKKERKKEGKINQK